MMLLSDEGLGSVLRVTTCWFRRIADMSASTKQTRVMNFLYLISFPQSTDVRPRKPCFAAILMRAIKLRHMLCN